MFSLPRDCQHKSSLFFSFFGYVFHDSAHMTRQSYLQPHKAEAEAEAPRL